MNVASADTAAQRVFLEQLRDNPVALRSRMDRDDIEEIEIVPSTDFDVAATRQVLKVTGAAERTGEIDAVDVLEAIDIVDVIVPVVAPAPFTATSTQPMPAMSSSPSSAPMPAALRQPPPSGTFEGYRAIEADDDAYFAVGEHISTGAVTFNLSEDLEPSESDLPMVHRRSLGWLVGTVLAAAAALVVGAVVAENFPRADATASTSASSVGADGVSAHAGQAPQAPAFASFAAASKTVSAAEPASAPAAASMPTIDVRSLPAVAVGTIVGPARLPIFVDGARVSSSTAVVACGKHVVKIGTSRKPRTVDVPCGGQIAVR